MLDIIEYWLIAVTGGSWVLTHLGCWHTQALITVVLRGKNRKWWDPPPTSPTPVPSLMNPAWRSFCVAHLLKTHISFLPLFRVFLRCSSGQTLWWLWLSSLGCSDGSLSTRKDLLKHTAVGCSKAFIQVTYAFLLIINLLSFDLCW